MKKLNNSNFSLIEDIIKDIDFNYDKNNEEKIELLSKYWKESIGEKICNLSKVYEFTTNNVLKIICSDSYTANELYYVKEKLINIMNEKIKNMGIKIKDIKFDYKKWKERAYD